MRLCTRLEEKLYRIIFRLLASIKEREEDKEINGNEKIHNDVYYTLCS